MFNETPRSNPDSSWQITRILLKKMSEIEPEDIANFRKKIKHDSFDIFDKLEPSKQEAIVAIDKMSSAELELLADQGQKYLPGAHDVSQYMTVIYGLTEDSRFEKLVNKTPEQIDREPEINYENFLRIKKVDIKSATNQALSFSISENFTIFATSDSHEHLFHAYGVDPEKTLTEGYILFDKNGDIKEIQFKNERYQKIPAFTGSFQELAKLKQATETVIRKAFEKNKKPAT